MYVPPHPPNPDYGRLICRRGVRLSNLPGETTGELEDPMHAMRCRVVHDGTTILAVESDFHRYPLTTCPGAATMIEALVGLPLTTTAEAFYGEARRHCTHMHDLVWWTIAHARRGEAVRHYECVVPDHPRGREVEVTLLLDGATRLVWRVKDDIIVGPEPYAGLNLFKGFVGWANRHLEGEALEAALVLHKGYFISISHQIRPEGGPLPDFEKQYDGICWSYSQPRMDAALRLANYREFPEGDGLLAFRDWDPGMPETAG